MRRRAVDIGGDDVRFPLVYGRLFGSAGVVDRVDHVENLPGASPVAQTGKSHGGPDGGVGVLPPVLPHPRYIALDVAGIEVRRIERRVQKLDQSVLAAHEMPVQGLHGRACPLGVSRSREDGPALGDGVDAAFVVFRRTQRRAVVEVRTAVPLSVPPVRFDVTAQFGCLLQALFGKRGVPVPAGQRGERDEHMMKEEAEPDALALAVFAHQIHAVVPVA
ncbi:hypothetical protein DSECCO2_362150 [anaerobic digester metagenome]